jgi:hypothetical protein
MKHDHGSGTHGRPSFCVCVGVGVGVGVGVCVMRDAVFPYNILYCISFTILGH